MIDVYIALVKAGAAEHDAKAAVESVNRVIDTRCGQRTQQSTTRIDLSEAKVKIIKWTIGSALASVCLFATINNLWH